MMAWVSLLFEGVMATLMVALIIYCVKLNRRLAMLRNQEAEMAEMIAGFRDASDRAEQSAQRLKAAGLAAERSLRGAILEAEAAQRDLSRSSAPAAPAAPEPPATTAPVVDLMKGEGRSPVEPRPPQRDMLMGQSSASPGNSKVPKRAKTREEAEQTVLDAIRSAREGVA
jgi:hypothetical protein